MTIEYMVFIEQRWLAMCAELMNRKIYEFSSIEDLFGSRQKYFTHLWGYKQKFKDNQQLAEKFCKDCSDRREYDFPDVFEKFKMKEWFNY